VSTTVATGDLAFDQAPALDAAGRLTFAAAADTFGTATVTVTLDDGNGGTATQTFTLTVNPVNDPPTSTVLQPTLPQSGVGPQSIPGVLALDTGAANEADTLVVSVSVASTSGNIGFTAAPAIDANGTLTYTARRNSIGSAKLAITVSDGVNATSVQFVTISVDTTGPVETIGYPEFAVGSDLGLTYVSFHNPDQSERFFSPAFPGTEFGARVAGADFTGDGIADLVIGSGVGRTTLVQVIDAVTQQALFVIQPFESSFTGGVYVAAGDLDGDGVADLVITPDEGGGPRVRVFDGASFKLVADFFGIDDENFRGGARAALGDLTGDAKADLVVAAGFGGGPRIAGFDGAAIATGQAVKLFNDFFAFEQTLRNGVFVAVGDIDGDGRAEVFAGGGPGGGPRITAFDGAMLLKSGGATLTTVSNFFAGDTEDRGGIRIAVKDLDGDNRADLVVGSGTDDGSTVTAYLAPNLGFAFPPEAFTFEAFDDFVGGVFVG
jgi:large repetitive protein